MKDVTRWLKFSLLLIVAAITVGGFWLKYYAPERIFFFKIFLLADDCTYPEGNECSSNQYCINFDKGVAKCIGDVITIPTILFPIAAKHPVVCTQPTKSGKDRTHSWINTAYAVDLATPKGLEPSKPRAVFAGQVVTHTGCDNNDGSEFNNDFCGNGFGNWVALISDDHRYIAFYAHLRNVQVAMDQAVNVGDVLGEEGKTGAAGHRHLHFSIHGNSIDLNRDKMLQYGTLLPPSIQYESQIIVNGNIEKMNVTKFPCQDSNDLTREPFYGTDE